MHRNAHNYAHTEWPSGPSLDGLPGAGTQAAGTGQRGGGAHTRLCFCVTQGRGEPTVRKRGWLSGGCPCKAAPNHRQSIERHSSPASFFHPTQQHISGGGGGVGLEASLGALLSHPAAPTRGGGGEGVARGLTIPSPLRPLIPNPNSRRPPPVSPPHPPWADDKCAQGTHFPAPPPFTSPLGAVKKGGYKPRANHLPNLSPPPGLDTGGLAGGGVGEASPGALLPHAAPKPVGGGEGGRSSLTPPSPLP